MNKERLKAHTHIRIALIGLFASVITTIISIIPSLLQLYLPRSALAPSEEVSAIDASNHGQVSGNIVNSGDGVLVVGEGNSVAVSYYQYDHLTGKFIETEWSGSVQTMADAFKGWEENGKQYQYLYFGRFMQETGDDDPIKWRILTVDRRSNRVLLLSDKILYAHSYGSSIWKESSVYYWLNNTFLLTSFNEAEQSALYSNHSRGTVFILSEEDYLEPAYGFSKSTAADKQRIAEPTTYARDCGLIGAPYYTLTPYSSLSMSAIMGNGRIQEARRERGDVGIRPAMWIDLSTANFDLSGDGTDMYPFMIYEKQ